METMMDMGNFNLTMMEIIGAAVLLLVLVWAVIRTKSKGRETSNPRTEEATRELYQAEDRAAKQDEL
jgi:hypothetical protein